jgi:hypothetical protein
MLEAAPVAGSGEQPAGPDDVAGLEERMSRADLWEAGADERERLADERERLADEREALADERERLADRHDRGLDQRETDGQSYGASGNVDGAAQVAVTQAALHRAEAGLRRAEAQVLRARQAAAPAGAHAARHTTAAARVAAADQAQQTTDPDGRDWLADRRDFVAAERDDLADTRESLADARDDTAGLRERLADDREHEGLDRERRLDQRHRSGHLAGGLRRLVSQDRPPYAELRANGEQQRGNAAASRRAAAADRARTALSWGPQAYGPMLLASFTQLAQQLVGSDELADALPQVLKYTVGAVAGCDWASITLWRRERVVHTVASNAVAAELDDLQFGTGLGPSLDAMHSQHPTYAPRLADSPRWPVLAATATQLGAASVLSHGLFVHHPAQWSAIGAMSLYSASPDAFSDEDQEFASILAAFVAVAGAIAQRREEVERREAALHRGLSTRDVIGQAKGILMERQRLSAGDAFDLLRRASQRLNRRLAEVARHLTETGELPNSHTISRRLRSAPRIARLLVRWPRRHRKARPAVRPPTLALLVICRGAQTRGYDQRAAESGVAHHNTGDHHPGDSATDSLPWRAVPRQGLRPGHRRHLRGHGHRGRAGPRQPDAPAPSRLRGLPRDRGHSAGRRGWTGIPGRRRQCRGVARRPPAWLRRHQRRRPLPTVHHGPTFEQFVAAAAGGGDDIPDPARLTEIAAAHDIDIVGPRLVP